MIPVLAIRTSSGDMPSLAAARFAITRASASPCLAMQALAQPEFTTITCARPFVICFWDKTTGADLIWLVVKTPAALQGTSEQRIAKSSLSSLFIPALTAPARNPEAEVTLPEGIKVNTKLKYIKKLRQRLFPATLQPGQFLFQIALWLRLDLQFKPEVAFAYYFAQFSS
jgi:hypothetical protein